MPASPAPSSGRGPRSEARTAAALVVVALIAPGCGGEGDANLVMQVDTLETGQIVVSNGTQGLWPTGQAWRIEEELRIGKLDSSGPESFGRINSITADAAERIWVAEGHAAELRVFGPDGDHLRTVGRSGEGPGEFSQPVRVDISPDGDVWVMDPQNARITTFDSLGALLSTRAFGGGWVTIPWRGGFDQAGRYRTPVIRFEPEFKIQMAVLDDSLNVIDTLPALQDLGDRLAWRIQSESGPGVAAGVPFQGRLVWRLSPTGTVWGMITDQYRLFELSADGDTLRSMTKSFESLTVTRQDLAKAMEGLEWFTNQGGVVDPSMIPSRKPLVHWFFADEDNHVWVAHAGEADAAARVFDVFDPQARFMGRVALPFELQEVPIPFTRGGKLYGVTRDEFDVQYVVRARVVKP